MQIKSFLYQAIKFIIYKRRLTLDIKKQGDNNYFVIFHDLS